MNSSPFVLDDIMAGHQPAARFGARLVELANSIDTLLTPSAGGSLPELETRRLLRLALVDLPRDAFFVANTQRLGPLLRAWIESALEPGDTGWRPAAITSLTPVLLQCAAIAGGDGWCTLVEAVVCRFLSAQHPKAV